MKILLANVDSTIYNLALMKVTAYFQQRGDQVILYDHCPQRRLRKKSNGIRLPKCMPLEMSTERFDKAYLSCVFTWNRKTAHRIAAVVNSPEVFIGGQGINYERLPPEIEAMLPDYSIYPDPEYCVGFVNRGCFRKCTFCSVPKLEGLIRPERFLHPSIWVPDWAKNAVLLDNEFADYAPSQQEEILAWFDQAGVKACISQGLDLRIIARNPSLAQLYAAHKPWDMRFGERCVYCAWDFPGMEAPVRKGIEALLSAGFKSRQIRCYTIVGVPKELGGTTHAQDLYRFNVLWKEYGIRPFVMRFNKRTDDKWLNQFTRFVNSWEYRNVEWQDFERGNFKARDFVLDEEPCPQ